MKNHLFLKQILILGVTAFFVMGVYIIFSNQTYRIGYPLDDAWIHQTFARNLVHYRQFAYSQGVPSAGSTAPLWTFLLSIGYLFTGNNYTWTMILGWASLVTLGWLGEGIFARITDRYDSRIPWVGLLLMLEWHFVWAAASGMETLILADISLGILLILLGKKIRWFVVGILIGLGIWIRPDALMLLGPVIVILIITISQRKAGGKDAGWLILGAILLFIPYLLFNHSISGNFWPNTFFAKQLEYQEILQLPLLTRVWTVFQQHIVGMGILLLPGLFYRIWVSCRNKEWRLLTFVIWWAGFLLVYAMRLPVGYQHGRYEIPVMPFFLIVSGSGVYAIWRLCQNRRIPRILSTAWVLAIIIVNTAFYWLGARTYATDVAIIESEMVDTAKWINANTPQESVIAAHDIGALGFFGERQILDLAGLISPVVLPVIRDETGLLILIQKSDVDFLMTFPSWYPAITSKLTAIHISGGVFSPSNGGDNMTVYKINTK